MDVVMVRKPVMTFLSIDSPFLARYKYFKNKFNDLKIVLVELDIGE